MPSPDAQERLVNDVLAAVQDEDVVIAPIGAAYFLYRGAARQFTKDVDVVIHGQNLEPAPLEVLKRIGARLGEIDVSEDEAMVTVTVGHGEKAAVIELLRGRSARRKGFLPRSLLVEAATAAERRGRLLLYPLEYVLVLKADAAVDREERAERDVKRSDDHRRRAIAFRADVQREVNRAMLHQGLDVERLASGVSHLKRNRQAAVRALLVGSGAPLTE